MRNIFEDESSETRKIWEDIPERLENVIHGFNCLIIKNSMSALCGYCGVPNTHPLFGIDYNDLDDKLQVHGGITYSDFYGDDGLWYIGFDCAHLGDYVPMINMGLPENYKDHTFVMAEVESLASQLFDLNKLKLLE